MNGVWLVALSSLGFSAGHMLIKALGPDVPFYWVAFLRNLTPLPLLALAVGARGVGFSSPNWKGLVLRGIWGGLGVACLAWCLPRMPLADAVLLAHASPLWAALWGALLLGEAVEAGPAAWLGLAFGGVCLTLRPKLAFAGLPYFAALASGLFSSIAHVAVRARTKTEPILRIVFYAALAGALLFLPLALNASRWPSAREVGLLSLVGLVVTGAQLLLTEGLARAPVSRAAGAILMTVAANLVGGWAIWGERPDALGWAGCALTLAGIAGLSRAH